MGMVTQKEAKALIGKLPQPSGMYRPSWLRMKKLLKALCGYLPEPYPGIRRLAADTRLPPRTVAHLLEKAESLGLIARVERPIPGHFDGYIYRLTCLDAVPVPVPVSDQSGTEEELRSSSKTSSSQKTKGRRMDAFGAAAPRKTNRWVSHCAICGFLVWPGDGVLHGHLPVHTFCDTGHCDTFQLREYAMDKRWQQEQLADWAVPAIGEDTEAPLQVQEVRKANPAARLAYQFEAMWHEHVLQRVPEFRQHRCINLGPAIGYLNNQFLGKGYSEEHVIAYVEEFFDTLCDPETELAIKDGQSAWQLFTGWWGRTTVPDPAIERRRRKQIEHRHAVLSAKSRKEIAERDAAWERIAAAQDSGQEVDPNDLAIVRGQAWDWR